MKRSAAAFFVIVMAFVSLAGAKEKVVVHDENPERVQSVGGFWGYNVNAKPVAGEPQEMECQDGKMITTPKDLKTRVDYNVVEYLPKKPWNLPMSKNFWQYKLTWNSCEEETACIGKVKELDCYAVRFAKPRTSQQQTADLFSGRRYKSQEEGGGMESCQDPRRMPFFRDLGIEAHHVNDCGDRD